MHFDVYEPVWVKSGKVIDTIEVYILILLVLVTLTVTQGHRCAKKAQV